MSIQYLIRAPCSTCVVYWGKVLGYPSGGHAFEPCVESTFVRIRIRIILFWINKYEYNLCYNDIYIYTYKHNSRINPGNRYKDMCRGTSVTIRLPGQ